MLKALRAEVQAAMAGYEVSRAPVVRRSDREDMLLACDLPTVASPEAVADFTAKMEARGWRVEPVVIWLLLDRPVPVPMTAEEAVTAQGEAACCLSLLERHAGAETDEAAIRAIVKAAEKDERALQRVCAGLHAAWAERLRLGQTLPGGVLPYLKAAVKEVSEQ